MTMDIRSFIGGTKQKSSATADNKMDPSKFFSAENKQAEPVLKKSFSRSEKTVVRRVEKPTAAAATKPCNMTEGKTTGEEGKPAIDEFDAAFDDDFDIDYELLDAEKYTGGTQQSSTTSVNSAPSSQQQDAEPMQIDLTAAAETVSKSSQPPRPSPVKRQPVKKSPSPKVKPASVIDLTSSSPRVPSVKPAQETTESNSLMGKRKVTDYTPHSTPSRKQKFKDENGSSESVEITTAAAAAAAHNPSPKQKTSPAAPKGMFRTYLQREGPANPGSKQLPEGQPGCLDGLSFVLTGEMESTGREDATDLIKRYGGRVMSAISGKTSYVVVGAEPGPSKMKKAEQLKIEQIDEDKLFELIRTRPGKGTAVQQAPQMAVPKQSVSHVAHVKATVPVGGMDKGKAPVKPSLAPEDNSLWTVKYAPRTCADILGNKGHVDSLRQWLFSWHQKAHQQPPSKDFKRAVLISGPPGIGKTTAAHLVAKDCGYEVFEMNASDARNKSSLDLMIKDRIGNHSIMEYFSADRMKSSALRQQQQKPTKHHMVVMDEVDGMGGGDRGGMAELIQLIKRSKVPIVCICNDRMSPKVRSLANYCLDLRFSRPTAQMMRARLVSIATNEGMRLDPNAVDQLVQTSSNDIRQILNTLQTWRLTQRQMTYVQSKEHGEKNRKHVERSPFDLAARLLNASHAHHLTIDERAEIYFSDYQLMPAFVQENYARINVHSPQGISEKQRSCFAMDQISAAADCIAQGDLAESIIYGRQEFSLMPVHAMFSCVIPSYIVRGNMHGMLSFPSTLGQISKTNKNWRVLKELHFHMRLHISGDKNAVRSSYLPALIPRLTMPLIANGAAGVDPVIRMMDAYFITREDWDSVLELGLGELSGDRVLKQIPTAAKSAFTRTYNKGVHHTPFAIEAISKSGSGRSIIKVDFEDAMDLEDDAAGGDDAGDERGSDEDELANDKMIKASSTGAGKAKAASAKKRTIASSSSAQKRKK